MPILTATRKPPPTSDQAAWPANLEALRQIDWPHAEPIERTEPAPPPDGRADVPPLPDCGNLLVGLGADYRHLAAMLDLLDLHQIVYLLEPDLARLAAGLRQADLAVHLRKRRLVLLTGQDLNDPSWRVLGRQPLSLAPDHLLVIGLDDPQADRWHQRALGLMSGMLIICLLS